MMTLTLIMTFSLLPDAFNAVIQAAGDLHQPALLVSLSERSLIHLHRNQIHTPTNSISFFLARSAVSINRKWWDTSWPLRSRQHSRQWRQLSPELHSCPPGQRSQRRGRSSPQSPGTSGRHSAQWATQKNMRTLRKNSSCNIQVMCSLNAGTMWPVNTKTHLLVTLFTSCVCSWPVRRSTNERFSLLRLFNLNNI